MKKFRFFLYAFALLSVACKSPQPASENVYGTWKSLWEEDMTLLLELDQYQRFKVTLNREGQTHTNTGWYAIEEGTLSLKDSANYPLPVCNFSDTGRYQVILNADTLQFKLIQDACDRRAGALQIERFVKLK